jgi:hypothetical protein
MKKAPEIEGLVRSLHAFSGRVRSTQSLHGGWAAHSCCGASDVHHGHHYVSVASPYQAGLEKCTLLLPDRWARSGANSEILGRASLIALTHSIISFPIGFVPRHLALLICCKSRNQTPRGRSTPKFLISAPDCASLQENKGGNSPAYMGTSNQGMYSLTAIGRPAVAKTAMIELSACV